LVKFVRGKIFSAALTVGVIIAAIFVARRFGLGEQIVSGFGGLGETIGASFAAIPTGIVAGGALGIGNLAETFNQALENFQRFVNKGEVFFEPEVEVGGDFTEPGDLSKLLTTIERNPQEFVGGVSRIDVEKGSIFKGVTEVLKQAGVTSRPESRNIQPKKGRFDLTNILKKAAINQRIEVSKSRAQDITAGKQRGSKFGGFKSATEQEAGLQATLARNKALFPQFFK